MLFYLKWEGGFALCFNASYHWVTMIKTVREIQKKNENSTRKSRKWSIQIYLISHGLLDGSFWNLLYLILFFLFALLFPFLWSIYSLIIIIFICLYLFIPVKRDCSLCNRLYSEYDVNFKIAVAHSFTSIWPTIYVEWIRILCRYTFSRFAYKY